MTKKALILAGGGVKVAFQAGVLQVWLDEAALSFDHADGASGGVFNLAMYCQGMTGTEIADNWRNFKPLDGVSLNWRAYAKPFFGESLFNLDRFRAKVFPKWGLDWEAIRASDKIATFNTYNFSKGQLEVVEPANMTEDLMVSAVSLPMWFPPIQIKGDTYIDAVFATDANLEEAIARGADELWIIWTVSEAGEWNDGFIANYFQIIEAAACGNFHRTLERIKAGEFGREIQLKILRCEVPLHYLLNLSADRNRQAVELGVRKAREWCRDNGIDLKPPAPAPPQGARTSVRFTEQMSGDVGGRRLTMRLKMYVDDVDDFVTNPDHPVLASGVVTWNGSGPLRVERGTVNLLTDEGEPWDQRMRYRLLLRGSDGRALTLSGVKTVRNDPGFDLWEDTTVLDTRLLDGHVDPAQEDGATVVATGMLVLSRWQFLRLVASFRPDGPTRAEAWRGMRRFAQAFLGRLWDVYGRRFLSSSPV